jgi:hypothetical protein
LSGREGLRQRKASQRERETPIEERIDEEDNDEEVTTMVAGWLRA